MWTKLDNMDYEKSLEKWTKFDNLDKIVRNYGQKVCSIAGFERTLC